MGRVVHFEITSDDLDRAAAFYRDVFDWEINTWQPAVPYRLVTTGPDAEPGINGALMGRQLPSSCVPIVQVGSWKETAARIDKAGGKRLRGPDVVPHVGTVGYFEDSEGNVIGILEPA